MFVSTKIITFSSLSSLDEDDANVILIVMRMMTIREHSWEGLGKIDDSAESRRLHMFSLEDGNDDDGPNDDDDRNHDVNDDHDHELWSLWISSYCYDHDHYHQAHGGLTEGEHDLGLPGHHKLRGSLRFCQHHHLNHCHFQHHYHPVTHFHDDDDDNSNQVTTSVIFNIIIILWLITIIIILILTRLQPALHPRFVTPALAAAVNNNHADFKVEMIIVVLMIMVLGIIMMITRVMVMIVTMMNMLMMTIHLIITKGDVLLSHYGTLQKNQLGQNVSIITFYPLISKSA